MWSTKLDYQSGYLEKKTYRLTSLAVVFADVDKKWGPQTIGSFPDAYNRQV